MAPSIGLNLRVTGYCNQGGRKYMEDVFSVAYQQTEDEKDLEYAYFGIFDGHGGREAAVFAKEHLMDFIVRQKGFWSEDDDDVLRAIHEGFVQTHHAMWKELDKWPRTASGLPSTAGTTASIAFIRRGKIYIGHVGDSAIAIGYQDPDHPDQWIGECLTKDHKPECDEESQRIQRSGGKVVSKSGVPRVVWNRPKMGHKGPVRRSTHIDEIPFLAVARSLGDLWSYNSEEDAFIVSPEPDVYCYNIDIDRQRCLVLGTDGCWNMLTAQSAVSEVCEVEKSNEKHMLNPASGCQWINPSKRLVDCAIHRWNANNLRADNTSVVTVMLDPPGPPRAQVLKKQREYINSAIKASGSMALVTNEEKTASSSSSSSSAPGFSIISRYPNAASLKERNLAECNKSSKLLHDFQRPCNLSRMSNSAKVLNNRSNAEADTTTNSSLDNADSNRLLSDRSSSTPSTVILNPEENIQCNQISSSEKEESPSAANKRPNLTPKLSRELSALQLSPLTSSRRTRSSYSCDSNSDTENEAPKENTATPAACPPPVLPTRRKIELQECRLNSEPQANPHFLRSKEAKVRKASSVHLPMSSRHHGPSPTTVMALRPRPSTSSSTPTNRKRKSENDAKTQDVEQIQAAAKSPKLMQIVTSKPVMTRSRTARVLTLKK